MPKNNIKKKIKKEDFLDYLAKNKLPNQTQIAKHFNISKRTILRYFQAYNLSRQLLSKTPMPTRISSSLQIKILACYKFNKNINDVCKKTGISKYLVKKTIKKFETNHNINNK
jgi:transposase